MSAVRVIRARTLLHRVPGPDPWFGLDYGFNLYRGCAHRCIYCDSRSACYGIDAFDHEVLVKENAIELLERELATKRRRGIVGTGSMNDPYQPVERETRLARRALSTLARYGFGVHVITKSDLVVRDVDLLKRLGRDRAVVSVTITTVDDALAALLEPHAPAPSRRLSALRNLAGEGIETRVTMMPVLPFLEDKEENVLAVVDAAASVGVQTIIAWFGVTLRDRQRAFFFRQLDRRFPGVRAEYVRRFGARYECLCDNAAALREAFERACADRGIATTLPEAAPPAKQLDLL
ncbi:MAG: radical SAM protein [Candidatus Bipolaricaulota bacterium]|nr:MAG: radical SAM protein [Candidatus Bipolaricaulota bacterium]